MKFSTKTDRAFIRDLREWCEDELQDFDDAVTEEKDGKLLPIWSHIPEIDSKAVVKASPLVERHFGFKLPPSIIRRGGYNSFDDLIEDLMPKLRKHAKKKASRGSGIKPTSVGGGQ